MTKIVLPPMLPHPEPMVMKWSPLEHAAIRARDLEVARVVLEAAAKVCRDFAATDSLSNYGLVMARMIDEAEVSHE